MKGHCCLFESREKCPALCGGRSPSERRQQAGGRQPWDDPILSTTGPDGADERPRWALVEEAGGGLRGTWLLSARAPLCAPGVAPVVVVPVVWRPLALVLIVLVPLLGILGRNQERQVVPHPDPHLAPALTPLSPRVARGAVITADTRAPREIKAPREDK